MNKHGMYATLGASNHSENEREIDDFYATDPIAARLLLECENLSQNIWEPACGQGHLAQVFKDAGHTVRATDLIDRGYGEVQDFLSTDEKYLGDIITNPPFRLAKEFILKALDAVSPGNKVCMFLKIQFMEGKGRKELFTKYPPKTIYVTSSRIGCAKNGDFQQLKKDGGTALAQAWYVWEKGFNKITQLKWIN
jgi:hypothetical protein